MISTACLVQSTGTLTCNQTKIWSNMLCDEFNSDEHCIHLGVRSFGGEGSVLHYLFICCHIKLICKGGVEYIQADILNIRIALLSI